MIMLMETYVIYIVLAITGLAMGSFAGATVWRFRAMQLKQEKKAKEKIDEQEYEQLLPLIKTSVVTDRSRCLHCGEVLKWYDLIPLISWLSTKGRCRYCKEFIGWLEPVIEVGTMLLFVASFMFWPESLAVWHEMVAFGLWLVACVMLVILFTYDLKWFILPNYVIFPLISVGFVMAFINLFGSHDLPGAVLSLGISVGILSGLYFLLWLASKGTWIGFGDVKLGLALALLLGQWPLAFLALFAANIIGCLIVLPAMLRGKITRKTRVPFGPLLIAGGVIAMLWGPNIINWYFMAFI
jgi:leader peptidase (prepilin peptidase)/N-methyltransferase